MVPLNPHRLASLGLALMLAGCGASAPLERDRYYSLAPASSETPAERTSPASLLVKDLAARGFLGGRQIVYRTREQPLRVERYELLLWEEPVPRALAQALVDAIRATQLFRAVVIPAESARADYQLGGEVETFEHHPTDQPPQVVAVVDLSLVRSADRYALWTRRYQSAEPVTDATPEAMSQAFDRLAAHLVAEVVRDLKRVQPLLMGQGEGQVR